MDCTTSKSDNVLHRRLCTCSLLLLVFLAYYVRQSATFSPLALGESSGNTSNWDVAIRLGDVSVGVEKKVPFTIAPNSIAPLEVSRVKTGCKCTSVEFIDDVVGPQADLKGQLTVKVPSNEGPFSTVATFYFEALEKTARLSVFGTAVAPYRVIPAALKLKGIPGHKLAEVEPLTFEIRPSTTVCRLLSKPVWCNFRMSSADGQLWGTVEVDEMKEQRGVIVLSDATGHIVRIPVEVESTESWTVHRSLVYFGRVSLGEKMKRSIVVGCLGEATTDPHIDSDCDAVTFDIEQLSKRLLKVTCTFMPQEPRYLDGHIRIHLGEITKNVSLEAYVRT